MNECPQRVAYYPGSADKFNKFKKAFSGVEELGCQPTQNDNYRTHPWMLKTGLTPEEVSKFILVTMLDLAGATAVSHITCCHPVFLSVNANHELQAQ